MNEELLEQVRAELATATSRIESISDGGGSHTLETPLARPSVEARLEDDRIRFIERGRFLDMSLPMARDIGAKETAELAVSHFIAEDMNEWQKERAKAEDEELAADSGWPDDMPPPPRRSYRPYHRDNHPSLNRHERLVRVGEPE